MKSKPTDIGAWIGSRVQDGRQHLSSVDDAYLDLWRFEVAMRDYGDWVGRQFFRQDPFAEWIRDWEAL